MTKSFSFPDNFFVFGENKNKGEISEATTYENYGLQVSGIRKHTCKIL